MNDTNARSSAHSLELLHEIPRTAHHRHRSDIDRDNVTERMLFTGLGCLSRWLKRHDGPGPGNPGLQFTV